MHQPIFGVFLVALVALGPEPVSQKPKDKPKPAPAKGREKAPPPVLQPFMGKLSEARAHAKTTVAIQLDRSRNCDGRVVVHWTSMPGRGTPPFPNPALHTVPAQRPRAHPGDCVAHHLLTNPDLR